MNKIEKLIEELCPEGVEYKKLGEIFNISRGRVISKDYLNINAGNYPVYSSQTANNGEIGKIDTYDYNGEYLTWTTDGAHAGTVFYRNEKFSITNVCGLLQVNDHSINIRFVYYILTAGMKNYVSYGMGNPKLMSNVVTKIPIPVPPLPIQEAIVNILDKFTTLEAELEARKSQYEYYRNELLTPIEKDGKWWLNGVEVEWKTLGEIGRASMCKRIMKNQTSSSGEVPFYKIGTFGKQADAYIPKSLYNDYREKFSFPKKGTILLSASGTIGRTVIYDGEPAYFQDSNIVWIENSEEIVINKYLYYCYQIINWRVDNGIISRLYNNILESTKVPIPPLSEQERIVSILDKFDALVNDITVGLPAEIEARRKQYEYYRNKLLTFEEQ